MFFYFWHRVHSLPRCADIYSWEEPGEQHQKSVVGLGLSSGESVFAAVCLWRELCVVHHKYVCLQLTEHKCAPFIFFLPPLLGSGHRGDWCER